MARPFSVKIGKKLQILILIFDLIPDLNKKTVLVNMSIFEYNWQLLGWARPSVSETWP